MEQKLVPDAGILFLLSTLEIGGSERKSVRIVNELHRRGIPVYIAYLNEPDTLLEKITPGIPVVCLQRKGKYSIKAQSRLASYVASNRIGHVLTMNLYPLLYAFMARGLARRQRFKLVAAVNTTTQKSIKDILSMVLYAPLLRRADSILFGCVYQRDMWVGKYNLSMHKSRVIYNGVDERHFSRNTVVESDLIELRERYGIDQDEIVIGTVGQLRPEKQQSDLVNAASRLVNLGYRVKIFVVGEGQERTNLVKLARDLKMDREIVFIGEIQDIRLPLALMDIFALTSVSVETFSNAALEAMSVEVPVLLSDVGGAKEMVREGYNGFIYDKGNVEQLTAHLQKMIENDVARHAMSENARDRIEKEFTFENMVDQYLELLAGCQSVSHGKYW